LSALADLGVLSVLVLVAGELVIGALGGLLGIVGGVIAVPVLLEVFAQDGLPAADRPALARISHQA